jgi:hypothetical protein
MSLSKEVATQTLGPSESSQSSTGSVYQFFYHDHNKYNRAAELDKLEAHG